MVRSSGKILKLSVALIGILSLLIIYFLLISTGLIQTNVKHLVLTSEGSQMVYDGTKLTHEKWAFSSGELSKGDRAIVRFTGSQTEIGTSNNTFVATIYDNQDNDVTNKYNIDYDYGRLEVLKRPITISALSETKNYDGEELVIDEDSYQILSGSLLPGHKTEIKVSGSITNVGITNTRLSGKIIDENGFDVSNLYDMDLRDGNLEIRPLPITIKTKNTEYFKYDGQIHTFSDKEFEITTKSASDDSFRESLDYIVGTLINEDKLIISDFTKEINAGVYQNSVKFRVLNKVGYDVTSNYNIKVNTGELRIEAKTLHVKTNGAQKVYDGLPLTNSEVSYTEEDLLPGDVALVEALGSVTNAGSVKNEASVIVRNSTGEDISKNYHVILDAGSLTINKFSIRLRAIDLSKKYDGTKLSFETSGKEKAYETITELPNWFVEDFKIIATTAGELTDYKAGGVEHRILNAKILDKNGTNVTQNFEISQISGRIEILQHELLVSTCDVLGIYDGTSKKVLDGFSEEGYRITGFDLNDPIFKNIEIKPSLVHDGIEPYDGLNELQIIAKRFTEDGTIDVSKNFSIAYDGKAGRYNVAPRTFAIETYKIEKDFTGEEYIFPKDDGKDYFHYNEEDLVEGHTLVINKNSVRGRIPGEYNYEIIYDIVDENGIVVTKYYNCHESFSKLIINKRSLVLSIPNYSYKYDSTEKVFNLKAEYLSEVDRNLFNLSGEDQDKLRISLDEKTFIYPEDSVKNTTLDIKIFDGDEDVTNFFSIKNAALTFTIEKPVITISSHSQEFKYDTKNPDAIYKCEEADINDNELVPGHNLDYSFNVSITARGEEAKNIVSYAIYDAEGNDVTKYYEVKENWGTIKIKSSTTATIKPYPLTVKYNPSWTLSQYLDNAQLGYSKTLSDEGYAFTFDKQNAITLDREISGPGIYYTRLNFNYVYATLNGRPVAIDEIDFEELQSTVTVYEYDLKITTSSASWTYDGLPHTSRGFTITSINDVTGGSLPQGHELILLNETNLPSVTYAGKSVQNKLSFKVVNSDDGRDVSSLYKIDYTYGHLTINARKGSITPNNIYDIDSREDNDLIINGQDFYQTCSVTVNYDDTFTREVFRNYTVIVKCYIENDSEITVRSVTVMLGNVDVTKCFSFTKNIGQLN